LNDENRQAFLEYTQLVDPPLAYGKLLFETDSSAVVSSAVESQNSALADKVFVAAVASAGTHPDLVEGAYQLDKFPQMVSNHVATFLRYADAIDKLLESLANSCLPAAVMFGVVRFMLSVAVKNLNLFTAVKEQFEDFNTRLRRLDIYLSICNPSEAVKTMLGRVMIDILRFCGLATKYLMSEKLT
jgi:hypothetical protein